MKICSECQNEMIEKTNKTPEGVSYKFFKCKKCGEEIVNMEQLHSVAEKYRIMKKYKLTNKEEVSIIPEKKGILIIPH